MIGRAIAVLAMGVASLAPAAAYDVLGGGPFPEAHLPGVCCLQPEPHGFVVTLCGLYSRAWEGVDAPWSGGSYERSREQRRPRAELRGKDGWAWLERADPPAAACDAPQPGGASDIPSAESGGHPRLPPGCPNAIAAVLPVLTEAEARRLRPDADPGASAAGRQEIGGCLAHGGYVWLGLAFYDSEGITGVGGVGRFDSATGRVEIRRPPALRGWSSGPLLHDGRDLWLATWRYAEGGDEPAIGVVRYDWAGDRLVPEPDAMCGFLASRMLSHGGALWLASDGGLSRRGADGRWDHLAFRVGKTPPVEPTTCARELERARATVSAEARRSFDEDVGAYVERRRAARAAAEPSR